ncbi:MAG: DUF3276 family protein [Bacteroidetes bacterium]|nr:MAG: DUF3276 family protein [Bacteroidota bacterium]
MDYDKKRDRNDDVYTKVVKAGKRTYFFDVKSTKGNDLYLTLTESKKVVQDGRESYQKHKIFLYKEDFEKFRDGFEEVIAKIAELKDTDEFREVQSTSDSLTFESL